jgi:hypothetical protein
VYPLKRLDAMYEERANGFNNPERKRGLRDDRGYGHSDPASRMKVVHAAEDLHCSICDARPCYLLTSAAVSVVYEQLTENDCYDASNLISAVRYAQSLEKLHSCIARHIEVTREAWQLDNHFIVSEDALREIERQRREAGQNLPTDTRDPPSLN